MHMARRGEVCAWPEGRGVLMAGGERCAHGQEGRGVHMARRGEVCTWPGGERCAHGQEGRGVHMARREEVHVVVEILFLFFFPAPTD